jgi:hypothetical protein
MWAVCSFAFEFICVDVSGAWPGSYISITFKSYIMEDNPDQDMIGISVIIC